MLRPMNWPFGSLPSRDALHCLLLPSINAKEMGRTEGRWSFFLGALAHIFSKGWDQSREAKCVLKSYPIFFKILYITCLSFVFFNFLFIFWRYQCLTFWTVCNNAIFILVLFFVLVLIISTFFFQFHFRIVGYDGVQQTFKDYFKFKEDNRYLFFNEVM